MPEHAAPDWKRAGLLKAGRFCPMNPYMDSVDWNCIPRGASAGLLSHNKERILIRSHLRSSTDSTEGAYIRRMPHHWDLS